MKRAKEGSIRPQYPIGLKKGLLTMTAVAIAYLSFGQDGTAGIEAANTQIRGYFDAGTQLMYGVGALLGLIGAVKV